MIIVECCRFLNKFMVFLFICSLKCLVYVQTLFRMGYSHWLSRRCEERIGGALNRRSFFSSYRPFRSNAFIYSANQAFDFSVSSVVSDWAFKMCDRMVYAEFFEFFAAKYSGGVRSNSLWDAVLSDIFVKKCYNFFFRRLTYICCACSTGLIISCD